MRLLACAFGLIALSAVACGDDEDPVERLEAACEEYCDAAFTGCTIQNLDADTCRSSCGYLEQQLDGECLAEYTAVFECGVDGGFTCTDNGPIPNNACLEEALALGECTTTSGCNDYCDQVASAGCLPENSLAECVIQCQAQRDSLGTCSSTFNGYIQCGSAFGDLTCVDGRPSSFDCDEDLLDVGGCLVSFEEEPCRGYCFNAAALGCSEASTCEAACAQNRETAGACSDSYDQWLTCVADDFEPRCSGAELVADRCDFERGQYETCLAGG